MSRDEVFSSYFVPAALCCESNASQLPSGLHCQQLPTTYLRPCGHVPLGIAGISLTGCLCGRLVSRRAFVFPGDPDRLAVFPHTHDITLLEAILPTILGTL
jgi:hypothetical protein